MKRLLAFFLDAVLVLWDWLNEKKAVADWKTWRSGYEKRRDVRLSAGALDGYSDPVTGVPPAGEGADPSPKDGN